MTQAHPATDAQAAAAARGITVEAIAPDEHGNAWQATIPRKGRGTIPLARLLAPSCAEAARAALRYVGARGWV